MRVSTPRRRDLTALVVLVTIVTVTLAVSVAWTPASDSSSPSVGSEVPAPTPSEGPPPLNAAWAAEINRGLLERQPNQLAAIYGGPHDNPDAIRLRFIAALNAIHGGLGLSFATGAG